MKLFLRLTRSLISVLVFCGDVIHASKNTLMKKNPNVYATSVGTTIQLPCNTTPSTGDDQVALLLFYREDVKQLSDHFIDGKDEESGDNKFLNHKARPIYSIDAREAPLHSATHFPGDLIDSNRLTIKFEPNIQTNTISSKDKNSFQKSRIKKPNRKLMNGRYQEDINEEMKSKPRINRGMVYLEISNIKKQDAGIYRCRVDYRLGRTINVIITLNVSVPTTRLDISDQNSILDSSSKNLVKAGPYNEGTSVNLTCTSDGGIPPPQLYWYHADRLVNSIELTSTKTDQTAILLPLTNLDRTQLNELYIWKAFTINQTDQTANFTPSLSKAVSIDLNLKPKDVKIISSVEKLIPNKPLELVCQISKFKPIAKLIWLVVHDHSVALDQIDLLDTFTLDSFIPSQTDNLTNRTDNETNQQINLRSEYRNRFIRLPDLGVSQSEDGLTLTGFLSFRPSVDDNNRRLVCIGFNPYFLLENHYVYDSIVLEVKFLPKINLVMGASVQHEVILKGYDVFFQCNVQANPSITEIGWSFNDQPLKSNERLGIQISNTSLLLKNVFSVHSGQYSCYAKNEQGVGRSEFIQLNVQYKPFCKQNHRLYVGVSLSDSVTINCEMDANPNQDLQYIWTSNDIELNHQTGLSNDQAPIRFEANRSQLVYTAQKIEHFGLIQCIAISSLGSSDDQSCIVSLVPAGVPGVLSNCTQFNLTQQSFTLSCLAGFNGGLEQSFHLELWIKQPENQILNQATTSNNGQSNDISLVQDLASIADSTSSMLESAVKLFEKQGKSQSNIANNTLNHNRTINDLKSNYMNLLSTINLSNMTSQTGNDANSNNKVINLINISNSTNNRTLIEKELRKINYGLMTKNTNKLLNMNTLNSNDTENYDRLIKRLKAAKFYLMANLTSFDYPFFSVYSLPINAEFQLIIYASNKIGRSKELHLSGNTLLASHWTTDVVTETLPFNQLSILILISAIFLVLIFSTLLFVIKFRIKQRKISKKANSLNHQSIEVEDVNLNHLNMSCIIREDDIVLNSCAHQPKNILQKCELTIDEHVNMADQNLINQTLNVYPISNLSNLNSVILTEDSNIAKHFNSSDQFFTNYDVKNYNQELLRNLYLNQIILPSQQDFTKYQDNQMETKLILSDKFDLLGTNEQSSTNGHCVLLSEIYPNKLPDCCSMANSKNESTTTESSLHQSISDEICVNENGLMKQIDQNASVGISPLEISSIDMQPIGDCQFTYMYEDRLI